MGAGLAGLNAAHHLADAGLEVMVVEADDRVGGRIQTDEVDGFLLDRGFQMYNPSYPEGSSALNHAALDLKPFFPGAVLATADGPRWIADPRRAPRVSLHMVRPPLGILGTVQTMRYLSGCAVTDPREIELRPDVSTGEAFSQAHIGERPMQRLLQPFLSGMLADPDLNTSRRFTDLLLRSMARGTPGVPATGMQAIPDQLARGLRSRIFRGTRVEAVTDTRVQTSAGGIDCEAVIVATDPSSASQLVPGVPKPTMRALTTWYYSIPEEDLYGGKPVLVLACETPGPLTNALAITYAAPNYAPPGRHLLQATAVGLSDAEEPAVRRHLAQMYGVPTGHWELIARYSIPEALPAALPPFTVRGPQDFDGILVAGDHRDTPSIQGALISGRRAARTVAKQLV